MKKTARKLSLNRESVRNLTAPEAVVGAAVPSIGIGCTSEYTWYCRTASGCTNCPICEA